MKTTTLTKLLFVSVLGWSSSSFAVNFTQENVQKSQDIINQTLQAYGGADKIQGYSEYIR